MTQKESLLRPAAGAQGERCGHGAFLVSDIPEFVRSRGHGWLMACLMVILPMCFEVVVSYNQDTAPTQMEYSTNMTSPVDATSAKNTSDEYIWPGGLSKKFGKGSEAHKNSVTGDIVGDSLHDETMKSSPEQTGEIEDNLLSEEGTSVLVEKDNLALVITDPNVMYQEFGMVSPPVLALSGKAFFNFAVQQVFLLGSTLFEGWEAIKERLQGKAKFGKLSIGFQVIGQMSAVYSYWTLSKAAPPWQGWSRFEAFSFLVSQSSATVTIIVGLCNNVVMPYFVESKIEARIAQGLTLTGLIVGSPIWISIIFAGFPYNFAFMAVVFCAGIFLTSYFSRIDMQELVRAVIGVAKDDSGAAWWSTMLFFGQTAMSLVWLIMGIWTHPLYSLFCTGAFIVELVLPLLILFFCFSLSEDIEPQEKEYDQGPGVGYSTTFCFICGVLCVYFVSMTIPTALLARRGHVTDAAPLAFWGKKIGVYFTCTFGAPVEAVAEHSTKMLVYLSQLIGLPA